MLHHALFLCSMRASYWDETLALKFYALLEIRASERERTSLDLPSIMCCSWHVVCLYIQHVCNSSLKESTLEERCLEKYKQCLRSGWASKLIFTLISFTFSQNSWVHDFVQLEVYEYILFVNHIISNARSIRYV